MSKLIWFLPLNIYKKGYLKLPQKIFNDKHVEIELIEFTRNEKLYFLPIGEIKEPKKGKFELKPILNNSADYFNRWFKYGYAQYVYSIKYEPQKGNLNDWYILNVIDLMDKVNLLVLNHGFHMYLTRDSEFSYKSGCDKSHKYNNRLSDTISLKKIELIKGIAEILMTNQHPELQKLHALLELKKVIENSGSPKGLKCSLMVTILETLFSNRDEKSEIRYRFPLRMTKYLKGKFEDEMKYIKKLYDNRSAYYHTGIDKFTSKDESFLYIKAHNCLVDYIFNPKKFDGKEFDRALLK